MRLFPDSVKSKRDRAIFITGRASLIAVLAYQVYSHDWAFIGEYAGAVVGINVIVITVRARRRAKLRSNPLYYLVALQREFGPPAPYAPCQHRHFDGCTCGHCDAPAMCGHLDRDHTRKG